MMARHYNFTFPILIVEQIMEEHSP